MCWLKWIKTWILWKILIKLYIWIICTFTTKLLVIGWLCWLISSKLNYLSWKEKSSMFIQRTKVWETVSDRHIKRYERPWPEDRIILQQIDPVYDIVTTYHGWNPLYMYKLSGDIFYTTVWILLNVTERKNILPSNISL